MRFNFIINLETGGETTKKELIALVIVLSPIYLLIIAYIIKLINQF